MREDIKVWLTFLSEYNATSFSFGSRSSIANVSNSMPRNVKISVGSTVLSSATGTPHNLHISRKGCNVN
jgi:hypothetical protein